jgi:hypothetical protein
MRIYSEDVRVNELDASACEHPHCSKPATHWISIAYGEDEGCVHAGKYCEPHADTHAAVLRSTLPEKLEVPF